MKTRTMNPRAWRPAVFDEGPKRKGVRKADESEFFSGTEFEPGHRKRVHLFSGGRWLEAVYDRVSCSFWTKPWVGMGWMEIASQSVSAWTQKATGPGFSDPEVAGV